MDAKNAAKRAKLHIIGGDLKTFTAVNNEHEQFPSKLPKFPESISLVNYRALELYKIQV